MTGPQCDSACELRNNARYCWGEGRDHCQPCILCLIIMFSHGFLRAACLLFCFYFPPAPTGLSSSIDLNYDSKMRSMCLVTLVPIHRNSCRVESIRSDRLIALSAVVTQCPESVRVQNSAVSDPSKCRRCRRGAGGSPECCSEDCAGGCTTSPGQCQVRRFPFSRSHLLFVSRSFHISSTLTFNTFTLLQIFSLCA